MRPWISRHYHIKLPDRLHVRRSHRRLSEHFSRLREKNIKPDVHSDFSRLARMLRGCSVGLVLGGGGARGSSHVGMIKVNYFYVVTNIFWPLTVQYFQSILEAGIPIDHVAGVSIGSCMGGLWAQERDISQVTITGLYCIALYCTISPR